MTIIIEVFITCWLVLLPNGAVHCYCEGEWTPPGIVVVIEETKRPVEAPTAP